MQDNAAAVQRLLKAIGSAGARMVTFDDPCESIGAMAAAYEDFTRMQVTFGSPAAFDKLAAQYHITIRWSGGCGRATHVAGTNGGTMPCGAKLTMLGVTAPYYCAKCEPGPGGAA